MKLTHAPFMIALGLTFTLSACSLSDSTQMLSLNKAGSNAPKITIPMPTVTISNIETLKMVKIPTTTAGDQQLDVSALDHFIANVTPNLRHYPPNFPNSTQRYNAKEHIKKYIKELEMYAESPDTSYDILMRSATLNGMARNLDLGSTFAVNASKYVGKAIEIRPESVEANLLYGILLSEGGAFKTSRKYLDKAVALGSVEAEQTIAQSDLMNDDRPASLSRLTKLLANNPNNAQIKRQIAIVESDKYRIWDLPAPTVNIPSLD